MNRRHAVAIGIGGALGASLRWAVHTTVPEGDFPWSTFVVNGVGCALLGVVLAEEWTHPRARLVLHDFAGIGFCGGLTTFSTFAVELVDLMRQDRAWLAAVYLLSSVAAGAALFVTAGAVLNAVRALGLPLEEQP